MKQIVGGNPDKGSVYRHPHIRRAKTLKAITTTLYRYNTSAANTAMANR